MKKLLPRFFPILAGLIAGIVISSVLFWATGLSFFGMSREKTLSADDVNNAKLTALAYEVLDHIKGGDYRELSRTVHPARGVVFSPCATVTLLANKCFRADQIAEFGTDSNVYVWGVYSASGEPIEMTPSDYFSKLIFDQDYTAAPVIGVNHVIRSGNALENITEVLPDVMFVDFYFPGGEKYAVEDPDWRSLRLGFEEYEGILYLAVILHSEWTG